MLGLGRTPTWVRVTVAGWEARWPHLAPLACVQLVTILSRSLDQVVGFVADAVEVRFAQVVVPYGTAAWAGRAAGGAGCPPSSGFHAFANL